MPRSVGTFYLNQTPEGHFFDFVDSRGRLMLRRLTVDDNDDNDSSIATMSDRPLVVKQCCSREIKTPMSARLFAIGKDNVVYEYHHQSVFRELKKNMRKEASSIGDTDRRVLLLPIEKRLGLKRDCLLDYTVSYECVLTYHITYVI